MTGYCTFSEIPIFAGPRSRQCESDASTQRSIGEDGLRGGNGADGSCGQQLRFTVSACDLISPERRFPPQQIPSQAVEQLKELVRSQIRTWLHFPLFRHVIEGGCASGFADPSWCTQQEKNFAFAAVAAAARAANASSTASGTRISQEHQQQQREWQRKQQRQQRSVGGSAIGCQRYTGRYLKRVFSRNEVVGIRNESCSSSLAPSDYETQQKFLQNETGSQQHLRAAFSSVPPCAATAGTRERGTYVSTCEGGGKEPSQVFGALSNFAVDSPTDNDATATSAAAHLVPPAEGAASGRDVQAFSPTDPRGFIVTESGIIAERCSGALLSNVDVERGERRERNEEDCFLQQLSRASTVSALARPSSAFFPQSGASTEKEFDATVTLLPSAQTSWPASPSPPTLLAHKEGAAASSLQQQEQLLLDFLDSPAVSVASPASTWSHLLLSPTHAPPDFKLQQSRTEEEASAGNIAHSMHDVDAQGQDLAHIALQLPNCPLRLHRKESGNCCKEEPCYSETRTTRDLSGFAQTSNFSKSVSVRRTRSDELITLQRQPLSLAGLVRSGRCLAVRESWSNRESGAVEAAQAARVKVKGSSPALFHSSGERDNEAQLVRYDLSLQRRRSKHRRQQQQRPVHTHIYAPAVLSSLTGDGATTPTTWRCRAALDSCAGKQITGAAAAAAASVEKSDHFSCCTGLALPPSKLQVLRCMLADTAAATIQRIFRGYLGRLDALRLRMRLKEFYRLSAAAVKIQTVWRRFLGQKALQVLRLCKSIGRQRQVAAIKIQAFWRMRMQEAVYATYHLTNCLLSLRRVAAVELQRMWRGSITRRVLDDEWEKWVIKWTWDRPGTIVEVLGDFSTPPWTKRYLMTYCHVRRCFILRLPRKPGRYELKFVVDGRYVCDGSKTVIPDGNGHFNNLIRVRAATKSPFCAIRERLHELCKRQLQQGGSSKLDSHAPSGTPGSSFSRNGSFLTYAKQSRTYFANPSPLKTVFLGMYRSKRLSNRFLDNQSFSERQRQRTQEKEQSPEIQQQTLQVHEESASAVMHQQQHTEVSEDAGALRPSTEIGREMIQISPHISSSVCTLAKARETEMPTIRNLFHSAAVSVGVAAGVADAGHECTELQEKKQRRRSSMPAAECSFFRSDEFSQLHSNICSSNRTRDTYEHGDYWLTTSVYCGVPPRRGAREQLGSKVNNMDLFLAAAAATAAAAAARSAAAAARHPDCSANATVDQITQQCRSVSPPSKKCSRGYDSLPLESKTLKNVQMKKVKQAASKQNRAPGICGEKTDIEFESKQVIGMRGTEKLQASNDEKLIKMPSRGNVEKVHTELDSSGGGKGAPSEYEEEYQVTQDFTGQALFSSVDTEENRTFTQGHTMIAITDNEQVNRERTMENSTVYVTDYADNAAEKRLTARQKWSGAASERVSIEEGLKQSSLMIERDNPMLRRSHDEGRESVQYVAQILDAGGGAIAAQDCGTGNVGCSEKLSRERVVMDTKLSCTHRNSMQEQQNEKEELDNITENKCLAKHSLSKAGQPDFCFTEKGGVRSQPDHFELRKNVLFGSEDSHWDSASTCRNLDPHWNCGSDQNSREEKKLFSKSLTAADHTGEKAAEHLDSLFGEDELAVDRISQPSKGKGLDIHISNSDNNIAHQSDVEFPSADERSMENVDHLRKHSVYSKASRSGKTRMESRSLAGLQMRQNPCSKKSQETFFQRRKSEELVTKQGITGSLKKERFKRAATVHFSRDTFSSLEKHNSECVHGGRTCCASFGNCIRSSRDTDVPAWCGVKGVEGQSTCRSVSLLLSKAATTEKPRSGRDGSQQQKKATVQKLARRDTDAPQSVSQVQYNSTKNSVNGAHEGAVQRASNLEANMQGLLMKYPVSSKRNVKSGGTIRSKATSRVSIDKDGMTKQQRQHARAYVEISGTQQLVRRQAWR